MNSLIAKAPPHHPHPHPHSQVHGAIAIMFASSTHLELQWESRYTAKTTIQNRQSVILTLFILSLISIVHTTILCLLYFSHLQFTRPSLSILHVSQLSVFLSFCLPVSLSLFSLLTHSSPTNDLIADSVMCVVLQVNTNPLLFAQHDNDLPPEQKVLKQFMMIETILMERFGRVETDMKVGGGGG